MSSESVVFYGPTIETWTSPDMIRHRTMTNERTVAAVCSQLMCWCTEKNDYDIVWMTTVDGTLDELHCVYGTDDVKHFNAHTSFTALTPFKSDVVVHALSSSLHSHKHYTEAVRNGRFVVACHVWFKSDVRDVACGAPSAVRHVLKHTFG